MIAKDQQRHQETVDEKNDSDRPEGWAFPKIADIFSVNYGKGMKKASRKTGTVPVYGSNGVVGQHNNALTKGPTIIIGRKGTVGAVNLSTGPCWPIDTTYYIDTFYGSVPQFILYAMRSLNLGALDTSTAIPGLNRNDLYNQQIPLPPIPEQNRIVAKVEELLTRVNVMRERLAKVKDILKHFRQSVLSTACSGRLTEDWRASQTFDRENKWNGRHEIQNESENNETVALPEHWEQTTIEQVCEEIVDCPHSTPKWTASGKICIRTTNFRPGDLDLSEVRYVSKETFKKRNQRLEPMPGDVLYSREGGILGIACMIPDRARVCLGQRMMLIRTDRTKCISSFLMHSLNSPQIKQIVGELTGGSSSPHLNVKEIKQFPVLVPPITEQIEIVHRVDALIKLAEKIEKRIIVEISRTEKLTQAILTKAFRGELVPNEAELSRQENRPRETTSGLLKRIKKSTDEGIPKTKKHEKGKMSEGKRRNCTIKQ